MNIRIFGYPTKLDLLITRSPDILIYISFIAFWRLWLH